MRADTRQIKTVVERILRNDQELGEELGRRADAYAGRKSKVTEGMPPVAADPGDIGLDTATRAVARLASTDTVESPENFRRETIVLRAGRPVLAVREGVPVLEFEDAESEVWKDRLKTAAEVLQKPITAVGRIEVDNHPWFKWVGTGWLVDGDIVVTNRHVAEEFVSRSRGSLTFTIGFDRVNPIGCRIDLVEEIGREQAQEFTLSDALYVADAAGPDVAFFRVRPSRTGTRPPLPVKLAGSPAPDGLLVATVGYPAKDHRVPDQALMRKIYGDVFDKKRLAPGQVVRHERGVLQHDCTTLGGNSGSVVLDLRNGEAVALHFAGAYLRANYAVPAPVLTQLLREARQPRPIEIVSPMLTSPTTAGTAVSTGGGALPTTNLQVGLNGLEISLTLRIAGAGISPATATSPAATPSEPLIANPTREQVLAAVAEARRRLGLREDVVSIRPGYRFKDGWITDERVVVVGVRQKYEANEVALRGLTALPRSILGIGIDVTTSTDELILQQATAFGATEAKKWVSNYVARPDLPLEKKVRDITFSCHAGPDAGWAQLKDFLSDVKRELVVGMYDFTAPHIVHAVKDAVTPGTRKLVMTLQRHASLTGTTKADDIPEEDTIAELQDAMKQRFTFSWASVSGPNRLFDSSYHIKVAVRDKKAFWLSSGNWQSSNQPVEDPLVEDATPPLLRAYNREWHVIIEHDELSERFRDHLLRDADDAANVPEALAAPDRPDLWVPMDYFYPNQEETEAPIRYFPPLSDKRAVKLQPLLSPDNYAKEVLKLLKAAKNKIYFQNQSLNILEEGNNAADFEALLQTLRERQDEGLDVRIIFRRIGDLREKLTLLKDFGFDMSQMRLQTNLHTKGIVIDSEIVVVGSHNWSNAGTVFNRDASLIFWDEAIAKYYEDLFLYDWRRSGAPKINEGIPAPRIAAVEEELIPPPGMVRVSWEEWFGE